MVYETDWNHPRMRSLPPGARCVYVTLCLFTARDSGQCWPKAARLEEITGFAEATIRRHLASLKREGFIGIGKVQLRRRRINVYTLQTPPSWPAPPKIPE